MWGPLENSNVHAQGRSSESSEIVILENHSPAENLQGPATITISKSKGIHIGPKIITQTNADIVKGRVLGLEFVESRYGKRLRCSVAVFVCWAIIVVAALISYLIYLLLPKQNRLELGITEDWYLSRADWQAMPPYHMEFLRIPLKTAIIGHAAGWYCTKRYSCINAVLSIQKDHLGRDFEDIGPNYLVGGTGLIFEGRGANVKGVMVKSWNSKAVMIMFLGDYTSDYPVLEQFIHVEKLLGHLVDHGVLVPNYELFGNCQIIPLTVSPGPNIMLSMGNLTHWNPLGKNYCLAG